jgi:hypothetical protein
MVGAAGATRCRTLPTLMWAFHAQRTAVVHHRPGMGELQVGHETIVQLPRSRCTTMMAAGSPIFDRQAGKL